MSEPAEAEAEVAAWLAQRAERTVETACARVFLMEDMALKLKRRLDLGYLDFSTLERRLWALERELAFNRVTAPDIYRRLRRITRGPEGGLELDGPGPVVEHALEMRRFADDAVLSARPEAIDGDLAEALGRAVAAFHATALPRPNGGLGAVTFTVASNAELLRRLAPRLGRERVEALIAATDAELPRRTALLSRRAAAGFARRCHGDLHLANILVEDGRPILFDCIEFNDLLSDLDLLYDVAFLLMDLDFRGRRDAAARVLSAYLDEAVRRFEPEFLEGLAALPLMLSTRAAVRAHVCAHSGRIDEAVAYVETALAHLSPSPGVLAAVGGLSGTGKTIFAREVAPALGASPGAVVLRTDEIRKRLVGVGPAERAPSSAYRPETSARTYESLFEAARALLGAGRAVILDATFLDRRLRSRAAQLAHECGVPFRPAWLDAPPEVLERRVAARRGDASDATIEVLYEQIARSSGAPADWLLVDARQPPAQAARRWLGGGA